MAQDWVGSAMLAERNRLAKLLNQRMLRLERADIDYGAITKYKDWIKEYYGVSKTGKLRFPEARTENGIKNWKHRVSLRRELDVLSYFASADWETATVKGARKLEKRRLENFEKKYGIHFPSTKVMNEFLESESWKVLKKIYGSSLALRLAGRRTYSKGGAGRKSTVAAMDERLQKFLKSRGSGYDVRNMTTEHIQYVFGLRSESLIDVINDMEDRLPL